MKMVWQSTLMFFGPINVSLLIFLPTFYLLLLEMTLEGVSFWTFYIHKSVEIVIRKSFSTEQNGQFSTDIKSGREY